MIKNLTIILVTFIPDKKILNNCIKSLNGIAKIIIIDNGCTLSKRDIDSNNIKKNNITIIKNSNVGNGQGINLGAQKTNSKYILYLDVDTEIFPETIIKMIEVAKKNDDFAVIAPAIRNYRYRKNNYKNKIYFNKAYNIYEMNFVEGAIMLINNSITIKKNIKFDKNIFLYWEETDFFFQCIKNNLKILLIENLFAKHIGNSSTGRKPLFEIELNRNWHYMWSKYYYYKKNFSKFRAFKETIGHFSSALVKILFYTILNKKKKLIYFNRFQGLLCAYLGKKSYRRPFIK